MNELTIVEDFSKAVENYKESIDVALDLWNNQTNKLNRLKYDLGLLKTKPQVVNVPDTFKFDIPVVVSSDCMDKIIHIVFSAKVQINFAKKNALEALEILGNRTSSTYKIIRDFQYTPKL